MNESNYGNFNTKVITYRNLGNVYWETEKRKICEQYWSPQHNNRISIYCMLQEQQWEQKQIWTNRVHLT